MRSLRISAISFLNTAPLMWSFEHHPTPEITNNFEIAYTVPSKCAKALQEGTADIGIVPVITYASIPDLVIIPRITIAARGAVRSILLISKVPIEQIGTVAVDSSSRTSVALTKVLLTKFFGGKHQFVSKDPDLTCMLSGCDAALIIGDPALMAKTDGLYVYDLAQVWFERTGKPFVFAVWAVRRKALEEMRPGLPLVEIFQRSREIGLRSENIEQIARDWAPRLGLTEDEIRSYLTNNIHYELGAPYLDGLKLFFQYAAECGAAPKAPELSFL